MNIVIRKLFYYLFSMKTYQNLFLASLTTRLVLGGTSICWHSEVADTT